MAHHNTWGIRGRLGWGGEGTRASSFVQRWLGQPKPKQFCLYRHALCSNTGGSPRALPWRHGPSCSSPRRIVRFRDPTPDGRGWGRFCFNLPIGIRGARVFLPLTYVRARDPGDRDHLPIRSLCLSGRAVSTPYEMRSSLQIGCTTDLSCSV